jgi:hypothetical protein
MLTICFASTNQRYVDTYGAKARGSGLTGGGRAIALKISFKSAGYIFMLIDGSSQHHFQQIILIPPSLDAFVFYPDLRGFF